MKGTGMKYLLFIVLLVAIVITAGCVSENKNTTLTPTQIVQPSSFTTPIPVQTTGLSMSTPTQSFTMPAKPEDVNEQNMCQVMTACGKEITNNQCLRNEDAGQTDVWCVFKAKDNPSSVCKKAVNMATYIKTCTPSNPYEASAINSREQLQCMQGVGSLEYCLALADKYGISRDMMKSAWCRTNTC